MGSALTTAGAAAGFFSGVVDEVRIWNVARTAAQIAAAKDTEITGAPTGLLGRWGLNEASGSTTATDSTGNGATGTFVGSPGRVAEFNGGSSQYVTLGNVSDLRSATFTVELWFRRTGAAPRQAPGTGHHQAGVDQEESGRGRNGRRRRELLPRDRCDERQAGRRARGSRERQRAERDHPITGNTAIAIGTVWHHAAATYDGSAWHLYLDGAPDGSLAVGQPANAQTNTLTTVGTALTTAGVAAGFFAGVVDEVRIWNVARTAAQIAAAKDTEITGAQAGCCSAGGA